MTRIMEICDPVRNREAAAELAAWLARAREVALPGALHVQCNGLVLAANDAPVCRFSDRERAFAALAQAGFVNLESAPHNAWVRRI